MHPYADIPSIRGDRQDGQLKVHSLTQQKRFLHSSLTNWFTVKKKHKKAQEAARALFSTGAAADMPKTELTEEDLTDGNIDILTMLVKSGLTASKSEARRAVQQVEYL